MVTLVSGGLFRAPNSFGPKDHERARARPLHYHGRGRAGHFGGARVRTPGDPFCKERGIFSTTLRQPPPVGLPWSLGSSARASNSWAWYPLAPTELSRRREKIAWGGGGGGELGRGPHCRASGFRTLRPGHPGWLAPVGLLCPAGRAARREGGREMLEPELWRG